MATAAFLAKLAGNDESPRIKVLIDAVGHESDIISMTPIRRGDGITAGNIDITCDNSDGSFTTLFWDDLTAMGDEVKVQLYFSGDAETIDLYTGRLEDVDFPGPKCVMHCIDKMKPLMEKRYGSVQDPEIREDVPAGTFLWNILVDGAGLDGTLNDTNPDIFYTSWMNWNIHCNGQEYYLDGQYHGETFGNIIRQVSFLTGSIIWQNGSGKLCFYPPATIGSRLLTRSNCKKIDTKIDKSDLLNDLKFYYGYSWNSGNWTGFMQATAAASKGSYGARGVVNTDRSTWHTTATSAANAVTYIVSDYLDPLKRTNINTSLEGYTINVRPDANDVSVDLSGRLYGNSGTPPAIKTYTKAQLTLEWKAPPPYIKTLLDLESTAFSYAKTLLDLESTAFDYAKAQLDLESTAFDYVGTQLNLEVL
jgi:hypothetical protein